MTEHDAQLEARLTALFADGPMLDDAADFAQAVSARLERGRRLRPWLLGGFGVTGAAAAGLSLAGSGLWPAVVDGAGAVASVAMQAAQQMMGAAAAAVADVGGAEAGAPWLLAAIAGAILLGAFRALEEI